LQARIQLISTLAVPRFYMAKRKRSIVQSKPKASTQDIVGPARRNRRINPRWQKHYDSLNALRDNLLHQQVDLAKDALDEKPTFSSHMADATIAIWL
jgi:hypothetical protein